MKYVYFSDGTDNGKSFNTLEDAMKYLYQSASHIKLHLNGTLRNIEVTKTSFSLFIETYNWLIGEKYIQEIGIKLYAPEEAIHLASEYHLEAEVQSAMDSGMSPLEACREWDLI